MTKTETYRLIDREGFIKFHRMNISHIETHLVDGCFSGNVDQYGVLISSDGAYLIEYEEMQFFEKVENNQQVSGKIDDYQDQFEEACLARPDFTNDAQLERDGDKYKLQTIQFAYEMYLEGMNSGS